MYYKEITIRYPLYNSAMSSYLEKLQGLKVHFHKKPCYIIGKGPSLDSLLPENFTPHIPIIAINESIHKIESLNLTNKIFVIQQDNPLKNSCRPISATALVNERAKEWFSDYPDTYVFKTEELDLLPVDLSALAAIRIAKMLGSTKGILLCFDACLSKNTEYAKCIGHQPKGKCSRFLSYCNTIRTRANFPIAFSETEKRERNMTTKRPIRSGI